VVFKIENNILAISSANANNLLNSSTHISPLSFNKESQYLVSKHSL